MSSLIPKLPAVPPRPDIGRPSSTLTVVALGLAVVAWALTLPAFVQSLDRSATPGDPNGPADPDVGPVRTRVLRRARLLGPRHSGTRSAAAGRLQARAVAGEVCGRYVRAGGHGLDVRGAALGQRELVRLPGLSGMF